MMKIELYNSYITVIDGFLKLCYYPIIAIGELQK